MLTEVRAGPYTVRGVSVGGVYTSLCVPELDVLLDVGIAPRGFGAVDNLLLSHAHADHVGALITLLGLRGLLGKGPPRVFMPAEIVENLQQALAAMSALQRHELAIHAVPLLPGDEVPFKGDLWLRAVRTYHPVPSLGYLLSRRVQKLRPEHHGLPGPEIARRRRLGEDLFYQEERLELGYATDTLIRVLHAEPALCRARVLILECSFLDDKKPLEQSRAGCHIHLDEILERAELFECDTLVLMHFSQIYQPAEVRDILARRCPPDLYRRIVPFVPAKNHWPG